MTEMQTIGMLGGLSWESSAEYYRIINRAVQHQLGGLHSASSLMYSFDFARMEQLQHQGKWAEATALMVEAARNLQKGGSDFVIICSNTMHKMAAEVEAALDIPLLHIADATAQQILDAGFRRVGLLGTIYTMEQDFYKGRLTDKYRLEVLVPPAPERELVNRIIYDELCQGVISPASREQYRQVIAHLIEAGAQGIILGCTEIMLLVQPADSAVPLFDTTTIHARAAVRRALGLPA